METKELILKKALDMFAKSGYDSVSIRDIAKAVNIKESSIYYHFKNKQDILNLQICCRHQCLIHIMLTHFHGIGYGSFILNNIYLIHFVIKWCALWWSNNFITKIWECCMNVIYLNSLIKFRHNHLWCLASLEFWVNIKVSNDFFASNTMLTFKYLLNGKLTKTKKEAFSEETFTYINRMFQEDWICQIY